MRHGEAAEGIPDAGRALTATGKSDAAAVSEFLKKSGVGVNLIWHSPRVRAKQTAEIAGKILNPKAALVERNDLNPHDSVERAADQLEMLFQEKQGERLLVVGHLPFLHKLVSQLLTRSPNFDLFIYPEASVVHLERDGRAYQLKWAITPDLIAQNF